MNTCGTALLEELKQNNCKASILPISFLNKLRQDMEDLYHSKLLNNDLIRKYLSGFHYDYSAVLPNAQSIVVVAIPQPITVLRFTWRKKERRIIVPPIYIYTEAEKLVFSIAEREFKKENYSVIRGKLPLKLLAVRSGLSQYSRNNISYISGMGSFYRLTALLSDMPCDQSTWQDIQMMPHCSDCWACLNNCPTKCIDKNKSIIDASRCLTYFNECSDPFPDWLNYNWHNSFIGCMRCQLACPQNRDHYIISNLKDVLSESDIEVLLHTGEFTSLPKKIRDFLEVMNLNDYELSILQRNLKILLNESVDDSLTTEARGG